MTYSIRDNLPSFLLYGVYNDAIESFTRDQLGNLHSDDRDKFFDACVLVDEALKGLSVEEFMDFKKKNPAPIGEHRIIKELNSPPKRSWYDRASSHIWSKGTEDLEDQFITMKDRIITLRKAVRERKQELMSASQSSPRTTTTTTTTTTLPKQVKDQRLLDLSYRISLLERQLVKLQPYNEGGKYDYMFQMLQTLKRKEAQVLESPNIEPTGELEALCQFEKEHPLPSVKKSLPTLGQAAGEEDLALGARAMIQDAITLLKEQFLVSLPPKPGRDLPAPPKPIYVAPMPPGAVIAAIAKKMGGETLGDSSGAPSVPHYTPKKPTTEIKRELQSPGANADLTVYETFFRKWQANNKDTDHPQYRFVSQFLRYLEEFQEANRMKVKVDDPWRMQQSLLELKELFGQAETVLSKKITNPDPELDDFAVTGTDMTVAQQRTSQEVKLQEAVELNGHIRSAIDLLLSYLA